ncbi:MAG: glycosyltransferase [Bacteroidales bacterium]|nr:glycosyltransferase [Bacteroidales bacterium]
MSTLRKRKHLTLLEKMKHPHKTIHIYLSVTNDVVADQRIHRIASTLADEGYKIHVVGRMLNCKYNFSNRPYQVHLLKVPIKKGFLFYAFYNLWLLIFILFRKTHILIANDLDTVIPNFIVSKIKNVPLLFDSHEYFPEVPELINRKWVKKVWQSIEKIVVPRIPYSYTVCNSIADIYNKKYGCNFEVVRNLPFRKQKLNNSPLNKTQKNIIYQGALNVGRGIEKVIDALTYLPEMHFYVAGAGDIEKELFRRAQSSPAASRIHFLGRIPLEQLHNYTCGADLGISLEEPLSLNYYFALPNKLFDYIQAEIPVLVSDFPEMKNIVEKYQVGQCTNESDPEKLALIIKEMIENESKRKSWAENLKKAAEELCWENEKNILLTLVSNALNNPRKNRISK